VSGLLNRRSIMFALGAAGFLHELVIGGAERPFLLALCGALMGLPFVLAADGKWRQDRQDDQEGDRWSHLP
jgi:hypothetical protein